MQRNIPHVFFFLLTVCRAGALAVWFWLLLHMDPVSPEFFWMGESGPLAGMLPCAAAALLLLDLCGLSSPRREGARSCAASLCLLAALTPLVWTEATGAAGIWAACACAGLGLALTILSLRRELTALSPPYCAAAIGGGVFLGGLVVDLLEGLSRTPLLLALALSALLAGAALAPRAAPGTAAPEAGRGGLYVVLLCCLISGLGIGGYSALWETFSPDP